MSRVRHVDGRAVLHVYRTGPVYEAQKARVFLARCTNVVLTPLPHGPTPPIRHVRFGRPLPFGDDTFDVGYLFHVLEHHTPTEQARFLADLYRVLKPGAYLRISSPDLEQKSRLYLECLERVRTEPTPENLLRYRWASYMLFDQMVRTRSGGQMLEAIRAGDFSPTMMRELFGDSLDFIWDPEAKPKSPLFKRSWIDRILERRRKALLRRVRYDPRAMRECDLWHDDFFSLSDALHKAGFVDVEQVAFDRSSIPGWAELDLDSSANGHYPLEPSIYVECRKPAKRPT